jgi:hypothetical protein
MRMKGENPWRKELGIRERRQNPGHERAGEEGRGGEVEVYYYYEISILEPGDLSLPHRERATDTRMSAGGLPTYCRDGRFPTNSGLPGSGFVFPQRPAA